MLIILREYWNFFSKLKEVWLWTCLSPNQNYGKVNTEGNFFNSLDWNVNFKDKPLSEFWYHNIQHIKLVWYFVFQNQMSAFGKSRLLVARHPNSLLPCNTFLPSFMVCLLLVPSVVATSALKQRQAPELTPWGTTKQVKMTILLEQNPYSSSLRY